MTKTNITAWKKARKDIRISEGIWKFFFIKSKVIYWKTEHIFEACHFYTGVCLSTYIHIYICNHRNNVPSRLWPQSLYGNSCTWAHDVRLHIAGTIEPKVLGKQSKEHNISGHKWSTTHTHTHTHTHRVFKPCRNKMGVICMYSWKQCALAAITTMALWQFMHLGTWRTVSGYTMLYTVTHYLKHTYYTTLYYITLHLCYPPRFACWALLAHWYQECVTVHHMPKRRSCYKAIVVITMRTHCFHHCIITYVLRPSWFGRVWALRALCVSWISNNNLYSYIYIYIYLYI